MKRLFLLAAFFICLIKLGQTQPGRLDSSFGKNGVITTGLGKDYGYPASAAVQLLLQPDGSIYVVEQFTSYLTKRHPDGSRDVTYGKNGYSQDAGFTAYSKISGVIQADSKILLAGTFQKYQGNSQGGYSFALVRYKTDGSPDSSFSTDGKQTVSFGQQSADYANAVFIVKDGKILVEGSSDGYVSFARFNTDGSPDSSFSEDGMLKTAINNYSNDKVNVQGDGKIVVTVSLSSNDKKIIRFNTDGSLDTSFTAIDITAFYLIYSIAIQENGKIVFAGALDYDQFNRFLCRYNADGTPDTTFSGDGKQSIKFGSELAIQKNGKIVIISAGSVYRYNTDGTADKTFGTNGKGQIADSVRAKTVTIQPDGKILIGGGNVTQPPNNGYLALARFTAEGKSDNTFNKKGSLTENFYAGNTIFKRTVAQKDGKILAAGRTWNGSNYDFVIVRYDTDGSPDNTFGNHSILTTGITFTFKYEYNNANISIALQSDGKIVAAGDSTLARYNADGSTDSTFSGDGKLGVDTKPVINGDPNAARIIAIAIQKDGKILVSNGTIRRYNSDGSLDKTFGLNGKKIVKDQNDNYLPVGSIDIQDDGKIVLASHPSVIAVIRLNTDGSTDNTFGNKGVIYAGNYINLTSFDVVIQNDGKILVGDDEFYGEKHNISLFRFNTDGSKDSSFIFPSYTDNNSTADQDVYILLRLQKDGKIVVSSSALLHFNTNGSLDSTFNTNAATEVDFAINDIAISDNKLYAVGGGYSGKIARFLLGGQNIFPTVSITTPSGNDTFQVRSDILIRAVAADADGAVTKVEFYQGNKLLHVETLAPYGFSWHNVPAGNYTLTAKATDNSGLVTTSAPVNISVLNRPPVVSIIAPADSQSFAAPATIHFAAVASDTDGRITNVKFYVDSTLLDIQYKLPYSYDWKNVPAGTYAVTAKVTDNFGAQTTSAPITVEVTSGMSIVTGKPYLENEKTALNNALSLRLSPNPATNIVNVYTSGLQPNKPATISIISVSGIVLKTININNATTHLDVSSLVSGVYTIKIISGNKVLYKQFVKL